MDNTSETKSEAVLNEYRPVNNIRFTISARKQGEMFAVEDLNLYNKITVLLKENGFSVNDSSIAINNW